eukprot:CAMPEP_0194432692 /NCGR_PEP_ID=MMETSP0176-20130528/72155_1 /TAXON_ID=216777 /ORGANISM="Proboscia alata, Strain PI-D3" /LENGTH=60 /DNA_ID=CAMNT_0039249211 /DNA_START=68 /DNA_END=247 /DNA_ORIENTATION=-
MRLNRPVKLCASKRWPLGSKAGTELAVALSTRAADADTVAIPNPAASAHCAIGTDWVWEG